MPTAIGSQGSTAVVSHPMCTPSVMHHQAEPPVHWAGLPSTLSLRNRIRTSLGRVVLSRVSHAPE
ncbi:hypothetical protein BGZ61DRAFT_464038 [Ilyonectria robusta]|uniref:uncharacterized protein n=1 Tax=Ilyonectria robusta TaxID=1079257 RepID=UPI001E8ECE9D|nr:uncharacterized protein BGZ61DRAFT_464038 [Ilyonectria robusta]KAH8661337.1 hypothetical protein BGZ61DRAFT_464038 [Ilyonectria robusta]